MSEVRDVVQSIPERIAEGYVQHQLVMGENGGFDLPYDTTFVIPATIHDNHPIVAEMQDPFSISGFERPRVPLVVGPGSLEEVPDNTDIHNVPIKFPGTEYRVPSEFSYLNGMLALCASVERIINPAHDEYYAYLTLERSWVEKGMTQRTPKIHSDGLQGQRVQPKVRTEHGYVSCDDYPPLFFVHPFDMTGIDADIHDMDQVYEQQADYVRSISFSPEDIVLFDSYCLHQARQAPRSGMRGFFRVTYADPRRQFDRQGNTANTLFDKEYASEGWQFQRRPKSSVIPPPAA